MILKVFITFIIINTSFTKEVIYSKHKKVISVLYDKVTILRFKRPVKTINNAKGFEIFPSDQSDPDYTQLSIKPIFRKSKADIDFFLDDGEVVRLKVITVLNKKYNTDLIYDFISKEDKIESKKHKVNDTALDKFKKMILRKKVIGFIKIPTNKIVDYKKDEFEIELLSVFKNSRYNGYVFEYRNLNKWKSYNLNIENLSLGKEIELIYGHIEKDYLLRRSTKIYSSKIYVLTKTNGKRIKFSFQKKF